MKASKGTESGTGRLIDTEHSSLQNSEPMLCEPMSTQDTVCGMEI